MKKFTFILVAVYLMSFLLQRFIGLPGYPVHWHEFLAYWGLLNKFIQIFLVVPLGMHSLYRLTKDYAL